MTHAAAPHPYTNRPQELRELVRTFPSETHPAHSKAVAALLCAAGDWMRRSRSIDAKAAEIDAALRALPGGAVEAWLGSIDARETKSALGRAATEAVEAALAETNDEREMWAASAFDALTTRDRDESMRVALDRWLELGGSLGGAAAGQRDAFVAGLSGADTGYSGKARWLVALNPRRRLERDLLDPDRQAAAWWFTSRAACDELVTVLAGATPQGKHVETCPECRADVKRGRLIDDPPPWHVGSEERMRFESGSSTPEERSRIESHVARCPSCREALRVSSEVDRAILEGEEEEEG